MLVRDREYVNDGPVERACACALGPAVSAAAERLLSYTLKW